jgi:fatty-acyl-CoA synthase
VSPLSSVALLYDTASRTGLLDPRRLPTLTAAVARWGPTLAAPVAAAAVATPNRVAVIDDAGAVTFSELDKQSSALGKGLRAIGMRRNARLGVMCRNHRGFVEVTVGAAKAAVETVYLNTGFAGPQLTEVLGREEIAGLVIDEEFLPLLDRSAYAGHVIVVDGRDESRSDVSNLASARRRGQFRLPLAASMPIAPVLLTSGTTGTPKGARRNGRIDASAATAVVREIPYRSDDIVAVTSPLFHAWGLAQCGVASSLGATVVIASGFDAEATLAQIEREHVTVLAVVPAILQRLLASSAFDDTDLSSLRIVASSGSALPVPVVTEWLERGGPNLYNLYGSTEVGQATLATPEELGAHPNTAGHTLPGSVVRILDDAGTVVPTGQTGRIFVGSGSQFDGYTGGGGKEIIDGLMSTGDVGHLDDDGLLFVTGRADDMIVSGGENVFPQEVEDLLLAHRAVLDVAVVGVDDDAFGQRLAAHIVKAPGAKLSAKQVRQLVADQLARHKVPRDVVFVAELPRTPTGKIRRNAL